MKFLFPLSTALITATLLSSNIANAGIYIDSPTGPQVTINPPSTQCSGRINNVFYNPKAVVQLGASRKITVSVFLSESSQCDFTNSDGSSRLILAFDDVGTADFNLGSNFLGLIGKTMNVAPSSGHKLSETNAPISISIIN